MNKVEQYRSVTAFTLMNDTPNTHSANRRTILKGDLCQKLIIHFQHLYE
jgi:hypothetical protein